MEDASMVDETRGELEERIAVARENIRDLIEQASALSGAEDEGRISERLAWQEEALDRLLQKRDALLVSSGPSTRGPNSSS
jgi:hypothetical protein